MGKQKLVIKRDGGFFSLLDCFQGDDLSFCEKYNVPFLPLGWKEIKEPTSVLCSQCHVLITPQKNKYVFLNSKKVFCCDCFLKKSSLYE